MTRYMISQKDKIYTPSPAPSQKPGRAGVFLNYHFSFGSFETRQKKVEMRRGTERIPRAIPVLGFTVNSRPCHVDENNMNSG